MRVPRSVGALAAAGAACVTWGAAFERRWYVLRHVTVPVLRPAARGALRVLHVSDLHLLPRQRALARFLDACRATGPDLVVATGDLIGGPGSIDDAVALLARLRGESPAVAVLGSNDRHVPQIRNPFRYLRGPSDSVGLELDPAPLVAGLTAAGWHVLENRRMAVATRAGAVDVIGLGDPHVDRDRADEVDWSAPATPVALRLGVVHSPYRRVLDRFDACAYDLALAGHTHGGQVRLPLFGALVSNCDLPVGQARGLSRWGADLWLHVSAGLGHSRYAPFRFACRPEATVLDLVSDPVSSAPATGM